VPGEGLTVNGILQRLEEQNPLILTMEKKEPAPDFVLEIF
jgi:hypothetical protein